ncbi:heme exporter protein CcmB [Chondromyces apiculatus]|uniref:Heme exporter protein B n=1 Tax=Chondromyces apiculatus DSM 436 TaxID=1192034 RepID=A0A017STV1_9BACT|nr:heme exporter protein CcmB [Chondromyces apiculatus]EYF00413.1 ABC transporter involved in cytochrome c biogenesis, CcmB subunit [Chondromyces apiculatus DSM 436]
MSRPGWARQALLVAGKDLAIELSTGEIVTTSGFFAVLVAVIASLAFFAGQGASEQVAPGVIWVSVTFASVLALSRTWQREREEGALSGLLVMPVQRSAIFAGKALGVLSFVAAVEIIVIPVAALLFSVDLRKVALGLFLLCVAATPGIAASGTLFGAMTVRTRARDLVLASVLFPLLAPTMLAAVAGTRELFGGAPVGELTDYLILMGVFDVVFVAGGLGLFELLIEG